MTIWQKEETMASGGGAAKEFQVVFLLMAVISSKELEEMNASRDSREEESRAGLRPGESSLDS